MPRHTRGVLQHFTGSWPPNVRTGGRRAGTWSVNGMQDCDAIGQDHDLSCGRSETLSRALVLVVTSGCVHSLAGVVTGRSNCRRATKAVSHARIDSSCPRRWRTSLKILVVLTRSLRCSDCHAVFEVVGCADGGGAYKLAAFGNSAAIDAPRKRPLDCSIVA